MKFPLISAQMTVALQETRRGGAPAVRPVQLQAWRAQEVRGASSPFLRLERCNMGTQREKRGAARLEPRVVQSSQEQHTGVGLPEAGGEEAAWQRTA